MIWIGIKQKTLKTLRFEGLIQPAYQACDPAGIRTQDPNIKSVMLYQLSYGIFSRNLSLITTALRESYGILSILPKFEAPLI